MPAAGREASTRCSPRRAPEVDFLLAEILAYLQAPTAAAKIMAALREAPTQEEQIQYALVLRGLKTGWTPPLREEYFRWFVTDGRGLPRGQHLRQRAADDQVPGDRVAERRRAAALKPILDAQPARSSPRDLLAARKPVKEWTVAELVPARRSAAWAAGATWSAAAGSTARWPAPPATASASTAGASAPT